MACFFECIDPKSRSGFVETCNLCVSNVSKVVLGGVIVIVLAVGTKVRVFKTPPRAIKIDFLQSGYKAVGPISYDFKAC
jgi:hypothetical protein